MLSSNFFIKIGKLLTADLHVDCKVSLHHCKETLHFFKKAESYLVDS